MLQDLISAYLLRRGNTNKSALIILCNTGALPPYHGEAELAQRMDGSTTNRERELGLNRHETDDVHPAHDVLLQFPYSQRECTGITAKRKAIHTSAM